MIPPGTDSDPRRHYLGYPFIFATDGGHSTDQVLSSLHSQHPATLHISAITYLKPLISHVILDSKPPEPNPLFFVSFHWIDESQRWRSLSRVRLCSAWQILYNRLVYFVSFLEEPSGVGEAERHWLREQFDLWNGIFCELDAAIGRLTYSQAFHVFPVLSHRNIDSINLSIPTNRTQPTTRPDQLSTIFLQWAMRITREHSLEPQPSRGRDIERRLSPWTACQGFPLVDATDWKSEGSPGE